MAETQPVTKKRISADWFMRGALSRIGDTLDRLTGRDWQPSSSIATSQLIERLLALMDAEKRDVPGKGTVVPHNIKLKMQWDKFSADEGDALTKLRNELLRAAADHINDRLYYTYAPLHLEVKPDYFTEGVKLLVSFEQFDDENAEVEMNVTMPAIKIPAALTKPTAPKQPRRQLVARYPHNGKDIEKTLDFPADGRLTVGRTGTSGLVIDDISVSKVHASLAVIDGGLSVADTGSTNGTFINDGRIAYGKAVPFTENDRVKFGTVEVAFELLKPEIAGDDEATIADADAVQIGDFEFRSRAADAEPESSDTAASALPLETQKIDENPADKSARSDTGESDKAAE